MRLEQNLPAGAAPLVESELPEDSPLRAVVSKEHRFGSETWHELDLDRLFNTAEFLNGAAH